MITMKVKCDSCGTVQEIPHEAGSCQVPPAGWAIVGLVTDAAGFAGSKRIVQKEHSLDICPKCLGRLKETP